MRDEGFHWPLQGFESRGFRTGQLLSPGLPSSPLPQIISYSPQCRYIPHFFHYLFEESHCLLISLLWLKMYAAFRSEPSENAELSWHLHPSPPCHHSTCQLGSVQPRQPCPDCSVCHDNWSLCRNNYAQCSIHSKNSEKQSRQTINKLLRNLSSVDPAWDEGKWPKHTQTKPLTASSHTSERGSCLRFIRLELSKRFGITQLWENLELNNSSRWTRAAPGHIWLNR